MKRYLYILIEYFQQYSFETACAILFSLLLTSCSTIKEVPINSIEKIIIKDSIIHDTIEIEIPYERIKEIKPRLDTSVINTSYAKSVAYLDTNLMTINHSLEQKGKIQVPIDTILITKEVIKENEIPVYYEKTIPKRDGYYWFYWLYFYFSIILILIKIYLKFFK